MAIEIKKDMNIVEVCTASANHERLDSKVVEDAEQVIRDLCSSPSPENRYQLAQLVGFTVDNIVKRDTNWMDTVADVKRVGFGQKPQFKTRLEGVRAYIQAKGSTTPRSKIANKTVTLDTISVSCRPVVNIVELQNGMVAMSELTNQGAYEMECAINGYLQDTLMNAATTWAAPYYGTGAGVIKPTLDPMIFHWLRMTGGCSLVGDIEVLNKLADLTGFTTTTNTKQFADDIMNEQNNNAFIGTYLSAKAINLINPLITASDDYVFSKGNMFIIPNAVDATMRPLKAVFEGDVYSVDTTNIDDLSYEVRLDQNFGAGIVVGDRPYMGVYVDSTL